MMVAWLWATGCAAPWTLGAPPLEPVAPAVVAAPVPDERDVLSPPERPLDAVLDTFVAAYRQGGSPTLGLRVVGTDGAASFACGASAGGPVSGVVDTLSERLRAAGVRVVDLCVALAAQKTPPADLLLDLGEVFPDAIPVVEVRLISGRDGRILSTAREAVPVLGEVAIPDGAIERAVARVLAEARW